MGADIRIVAPDAKLSVLEARWSLIPDMTGTVILPQLVCIERAKELPFTGRMVSGEEAVRIGLPSSLADDPRAAAMYLAPDLVTTSPAALRQGQRRLKTPRPRAVADTLPAGRPTMATPIATPKQHK